MNRAESRRFLRVTPSHANRLGDATRVDGDNVVTGWHSGRGPVAEGLPVWVQLLQVELDEVVQLKLLGWFVDGGASTGGGEASTGGGGASTGRGGASGACGGDIMRRALAA